MKKLFSTISIVALGLSMFAFAGIATAASASYSLFGDASIVTPGNASAHAAQTQSSTTTSPGYGGVDFTTSSALTVNDLNTLSTDYLVTTGMCAGGAPRFSIATSEGNIFVYLGTPPNYTCAPGVWQNSGNLFVPTNLIDTSQLPGGNFYDTVAHAKLLFGSLSITDLALVTDADWVAGNNPQTVDFDNVTINSDVYTFEPNVPTSINQCKDGGWMNYGTMLKNQGDCVSYVATNGKNKGAGQ
jgi:hypothetical protein